MSDPIEVATEFVRDEFPVTERQERIDEEMRLATLMGSAVHDRLPEPDDLDILLHVPLEAEKEYDIPAVNRELEYGGYTVEVALATIERLERAARRTDGLWFYWEAEVLWSESDRLCDLVERASTVTEADKRTILMTEFAELDINSFKADHAKEADLTPAMMYDQCRHHYVRGKLAVNDVHLAYKWWGKMLQQVDPEAYEIASEGDVEAMRADLKDDLLEFGFSEQEVENWDRHNAELLRFQRS